MSFGWSAGDILAAIEFIFEVAQALDEVDGAAKDFREASAFLRSLITALNPLETLTALEARPSYKQDIEREVSSIRTPVEAFITDVKGFQTSLGIVKEGKFRHLQNIPSKLKWHFSTSKKALALQQKVERHLRVIDTLMQQLTVDMLNNLQKESKKDISDGFEGFNQRLNVQLPVFQGTLLAELSQRDESNTSARNVELRTLLEDLFEKYFGSQTVMLSRPSKPTNSVSSSKTLLESVSCLASRHQSELIQNCRYPIFGLRADSEVVAKIHELLLEVENNILWVQIAPQVPYERSLASEVVALCQEAGVPLLAYFSLRLNSDGRAFSQLECLCDLVYSLVYQICMHITVEHVDAPPQITERASELDGTARLLPQALEVLQECLAAQIGGVIIILDGIDMLDYANDAFVEKNLRDCLRILCNSSQGTKTFIITEGHSAVILDEVTWENTMDATMADGSEGFLSLDTFRDLVQQLK